MLKSEALRNAKTYLHTAHELTRRAEVALLQSQGVDNEVFEVVYKAMDACVHARSRIGISLDAQPKS